MQKYHEQLYVISFLAMIKRIILLLFAFYLPALTVFGQYPLSIQYVDKPLDADKIINKAKFKKKYKSRTSLDYDLQKLVVRLHKQGFDAACLDSVFIDENKYAANVYIGQKLTVSHVNIEGLEKEQLRTMKIKPLITEHKSVHINDIFAYNDKIANTLWNTGYLFATAKLNNFTPSDSGYTASILVEKNNFILLDSIIVAGNLKLGKSFLYGYLGLKRKKAYNEAVMKQVPARMQELEFADVLQPPGVSFSDKEAALYIYANKQKTNQFDGYLGIVPSNENDSSKILVTGSLTLDLHNVFKVGENLKFNWKRIQVLSQTLDIYMDFPYIFYSCFGIDGAFALEKKDTSYINMEFLVGLRYYLQQKNYLRAYYNLKTAHLISNTSLEYLTELPTDIDYSTNIYGLEMVFSKLDYLFNPRKGYAFSVTTAVGQRNIIKNNNIADSLYNGIALTSIQLQFIGKFDVYFPIKKRWVWYIGAKTGHLQANQLFENEVFRLGGLNTLRGFDQHSIYASTYGIINNELRFIFGKKSYLQVFFDAAWYECKLNNGYRSDIPFGFGAGISFDIKAGIFALNYALGKQLNNPIKFNNGKITFGYTALF